MRIGITCDLKSCTPPPSGVSVLPDDWAEEFDDIATIEALAAVFRSLGHEVRILGDGPELIRALLADPPDFVFNVAEGQGISRSREARVPALLEMLGIPHSGSDPLTLAVTLDKDCAKRLVRAECPSLVVPWGLVVPPGHDPLTTLRSGFPPFPWIAKPAWEGSSKGIRSTCLVRRAEELPDIVASLHRDHCQPVLLEEFIDGDELTVGILGNSPPRVLGMMRVVPLQTDPAQPFLYSLEVKRDWRRRVRYEAPDYPPAIQSRIELAALEAYRALGCRDVCRIDFRLNRDRLPYFLEANPLPGLNSEYSDLVLLARLAGWTYERLIGTILEEALSRRKSER
jgi:D-alanine-D-alanine ligase